MLSEYEDQQMSKQQLQEVLNSKKNAFAQALLSLKFYHYKLLPLDSLLLSPEKRLRM